MTCLFCCQLIAMTGTPVFLFFLFNVPCAPFSLPFDLGVLVYCRIPPYVTNEKCNIDRNMISGKVHGSTAQCECQCGCSSMSYVLDRFRNPNIPVAPHRAGSMNTASFLQTIIFCSRGFYVYMFQNGIYAEPGSRSIHAGSGLQNEK